MNHKIQSKLKEFGDKKKIKELQDFVVTLDLEQVINSRKLTLKTNYILTYT